MRAAILSIGDELTLGQAAETNARWLAAQLAARSILSIEHRTVADDRSAIAAAMRELCARADIIVATGGLGPTADDLTREALADVVTPNQALVSDDAQLERLRRLFAKRGRAMPALNAKQALRPATGRFLPNPHGTAPGLTAAVALDARSVAIFCLPGPPREMQPMFADHVVPALPQSQNDRVLLAASLHEYGLGEAEAAERLGELMERDRNPTVGTTASDAIISGRVRVEGPRSFAERAIAETLSRIEQAWHPYAFGRNDESLPAAVGSLMRQHRATLATAESCTGGWLGKLIVDVPGSSEYYLGGWVTYSNEMKTAALGVPGEAIERFGAVSAPVAEALAQGALAKSGADHALSITGVAGPDGGTADKPVGTVFISLASRMPAGDSPIVRLFRFAGDRLTIRDRAVKTALQMLRFKLINAPARTPLLWEVPQEVSAQASQQPIATAHP